MTFVRASLRSPGALSAAVLMAFWSFEARGQQLAFPEAEGFGRFATGARTNLSSAAVYHVTNLNDSGTGSLRDALSQPNRFVVFDVGGIVTLNSVLTVASNITIAGQTAPGGIAVYGDRVAFHGANNLVSRYWAVRKGEAGVREDAASIVRGTNMMFDHMSITWGVDGTFDINPDTGQVIDNLTIQNTIIAQGLDRLGHSTGGLMTLGEGNRFSIIKSLFADNVTRNPKVRGENEFINNVVYGYETAGYIMGDTSAVSHANVEGNYFIEGPVDGSSPFASGTNTFNIYANDNWIDGNRNGVLDGSLNASYPGANVVATRHAFPTAAGMTAQQAVQFVIENVGASVTRDSVDSRLAQEVATYGTLGGVIQYETDLFPGYGTDPQYLNPRVRLVDTDNDGMPDNWETSRGLNPANAADWKGLNGGYTRLEEYLNDLGGYGNMRAATAGGAWTTAATWGGTIPTFATSAVAADGVTHASGNAFARNATFGGSSSISGGTLDIFDTLLVGGNANGTLTLTGGTTSAGRVLLGATAHTGVLNLHGGTLQTGRIASGGGAATLTLNGGAIRAIGVLDIAVPTTVAAGGGTVNTNGFSGSISGGLSGPGTLTKTGSGTLTLLGNNAAFGGAINLNSGVIVLNIAAASCPTGIITLANGGMLNIGSSGSGATTPMAVASGATGSLSTASTVAYNGGISGSSNATLRIVGSSTGNNNFSLGGNLSGFAGTLDFTNAKNIRLTNSAVAGSALARWLLGDSGAVIRTQFGGVVNIGALSGGASSKLQGTTNNANPSTYVIGADGSNSTFDGQITDGIATPTAGIVNLTKTGPGTLVLTNSSHTYSGRTTVSGGVLLITGSVPNSDVLVQSGGTLGGSSQMKSLSVENGGTVRPGNSIGTMEVTGIATIAGLLGIELNGSGGGTADMLTVGGLLDLTGASLDFSILPGGGALNDPAYVFASYSSLRGTFGGNVTGLPAGYGIVYGFDNGTSANNIALVAGVVPEPGAVALACLCGATLLRRHRRGR